MKVSAWYIKNTNILKHQYPTSIIFKSKILNIYTRVVLEKKKLYQANTG